MNVLIGNIDCRSNEVLVHTLRERCMVCYTCVRECPGKAIKISNGQAEIVNRRCIGCGNCIKVCSQKAKVYRESTNDVLKILKKYSNVAACIAPSFPAEFQDISDHKVLVGMIRQLGFKYVNEVAFGADLVAKKYKELLDNSQNKRYISSDCPAIVAYIEKYHPNLVENLAPIASPMVALARVLKKKHGKKLKIVFIGPCIAKKEESNEVDAVITFPELRKLFELNGIKSKDTISSDFDSPISGKGAIFSISRGLVQTIEMQKDINEENIIVADGRINFQEAIKEFDSGLLRNQHLELLCCEGCVMGVGMTSGGKPFAKRALISNYVQNKLSSFDEKQWKKEFELYKNINLSQTFHPNDTRMPIPDERKLEEVLHKMGKFNENQHLNCGACGYDTCKEHAIAIINGLAEDEMCLPYTIEKLHNSVVDLALSNNKLASVRQALKHSEKLAHMGQLSAGVAHELNNPLGVIIMYTNLLFEECGKDDEMKKDLELIVQQAERCKNIVSGLLNFARKNKMKYEAVDINELIEACVSSIIIPSRIKLEIIKKFNTHKINLDKEQMVQALSNLLKNAIEAITEEGKLDFSISENDSSIIFLIKDTGMGIKNQDMEKIFNPFFTTKEIGKGTGLGLATTYGIIKMHKGKITVASNADKSLGPTGTTFRVTIPFNII
jgi:nitrogen-specific signal transduction histidine kinase/ferredoxin